MKWLCKFKHKFEHVAGSVSQVIPGAIVWQRKCLRCGIEQELSHMLGCTFLEREFNPPHTTQKK